MELSPTQVQRLQRVQKMAILLDNVFVIPIINVRFGLDPLVGLIPGVGDILMLFCSAYILVEAARFGVPPNVLLRMVLNIGIDTGLGLVPIFGDALDVSWKSNIKNVELLQAYLDIPGPVPNRTRRFVWTSILTVTMFVMIFMSVIIIGLIVLIKLLVKWWDS